LTLQEDRRHLFDRFTEVDTVRQVVGVGSVGMRCTWCSSRAEQARTPLPSGETSGESVYERHTRPSRYDNHGARVVHGKRLLQSATDIFVAGAPTGPRLLVRQFRDMKIIPSIELVGPRLVEFATACGESLARAHARTGDPRPLAATSARAGSSPTSRPVRPRYAEQNERDHAQLVGAIAGGAVAGGAAESPATEAASAPARRRHGSSGVAGHDRIDAVTQLGSSSGT